MDWSPDDRGVSPLIGVILIIGILTLSLSVWQVNFVPAENQQVEFRHYQDVLSDMQDFRNAIVRIGETNQLQAVRFDLGTEYPTRVFGVNAAPPMGSLESDTTGTGEVNVDGINTTALCGFETTRTQTVTYEPNYNYFQNAQSIEYENTVLYRETTDGNILFDSEQAIIREDTINLVPLTANLSLSGQSATTVDFLGEQTGQTKVSKALTITLPSELSHETWEDELLGDQSAVQAVLENDSRESAIDIKLKPRTYKVRCTPTGAGASPNANIKLTGERDDINPAAPGDIRLENERRGSGNNGHKVFLDLNNTAEIDIKIQQARINFYQDVDTSSKAPDNADIYRQGGSVSANLVFRSDFKSLNPKITLTGNNTETTITLEFFDNQGRDADLADKDWFVISLVYSNEATGTYFVPVPKK